MRTSTRLAIRLLRVGLWCIGMGVALSAIACVAVAGHILAFALLLAGRVEVSGAGLGVIFLFGMVASAWLAIAAHEGGHLFAAKACGLTPFFARAGPVTFTLVGSVWEAGWARKQNWLNGLALCRPSPNRRWQMLVFIAGGPLGNFAAGVVAAILAVLCPMAGSRCLATLLAADCVSYGLLNILPLRDHLPSDGLAFWRALRTKSATA